MSNGHSLSAPRGSDRSKLADSTHPIGTVPKDMARRTIAALWCACKLTARIRKGSQFPISRSSECDFSPISS
jgi:hypothetical protein